ncbi:MAG: sulfatase-like hydrolase/transferase [Verrucomicrobiota bacterium JB023]|nr:sulfatase-like hydrolase/transferase [Verrucomicrobiota bacterium JB023]
MAFAVADTVMLDGQLGDDMTDPSDKDWSTTLDQSNDFPPAIALGSDVVLKATTNGQFSGPGSVDGREWDLRHGVGGTNISNGSVATSAATAISSGTYINFNLSSATYSFSADEISVSLWRNGAQAPQNFQLAYSADGTWDTSDLIGTPTLVSATGTGSSVTLTAAEASFPDNTTSADFRLYYWDDDGATNPTANFHLYDVSMDFTLGDALVVDEAARPNVIIFFMDDMGYNDIGVQTYPEPPNFYPNSGPAPMPGYNEPDIPEPNEARLLTPRIDSLAEDGLLMTSFHTARLCSPSRASLLTGRYASRMNMDRVFNGGSTSGFSTEEVTLPEMLRQQGYQTAMVGKWHLGYNASRTIPFQMTPLRSGFQEFYGMPFSNDQSGYRLIRNETVLRTISTSEADQNGLTWELTEAALDYVERASADDSPFFLQFNHVMTHTPCYASNQVYQNADGTTWPIFKGTSGVSYYYDVMKETDHSVGRILDRLDALGIADNTIVIFSSDNGPWLNHATFGNRIIDTLDSSVGSAYPLKDGKFTTWEGGTRVPFLVRWPNEIPAGSVSGTLTGLVDLAPTLVGLAGGEMPSDRTIDGIDMWPVWSGEQNSIDRNYAIFNDGTAEGVLNGDWKLRDGALYDLTTDIQELTDVSGDAANATILSDLTAFRNSIQTSAATDVIPLGTYTNYEVEYSENDITVPEGGTATVDLRLSHDPGATVTVTTAYFSGDMDLSVSDGASLTFNSSNWSDWQTVTLAAAADADASNGGATFRMTMSGLSVVRELFVFEDDSAAPAPLNLSLVWPKIDPVKLELSSQKLIAEGSLEFGGIINPVDATYSWILVAGPGAVTFTDPDALETGIEFDADGNYQLRLRAEHPNANGFATVDFEVEVGADPGVILVGDYKQGPSFGYDATTDDDGNNTWENDASGITRNIALDAAILRTTTDPAPSLDFIDAAYTFGGTTGGTASALDDFSTGDASFEFWFKPDSIPLAQPQVLYESGGDIGVGFILDGSLVRFVVDDGGSDTANGAIAEGTLAAGAGQDGYVHCVGSIDLVNDEIKLYLNGSLADTEAIAGVSDWCGVSGTGLGTITDTAGSVSTEFGHLGGNDQLSGSFDRYTGEIAYFLFYDRVLTSTQVTELSSCPREESGSGSPEGFAPLISAGNNQTIALPDDAALLGEIASGDESLTFLWDVFDGPSGVSFADSSALATIASFSSDGIYTLWLEVDDGEIKVFDDTLITVEAALSNFETWAAAEGIAATPLGDSNNNGIADILDFALGDDASPQITPDSPQTVLFASEALADGYVLQIEYSFDLTKWNVASTVSDVIQITQDRVTGEGDRELTFEVVDPPAEKLFIRYAIGFP